MEALCLRIFIDTLGFIGHGEASIAGTVGVAPVAPKGGNIPWFCSYPLGIFTELIGKSIRICKGQNCMINLLKVWFCMDNGGLNYCLAPITRVISKLRYL